MHSVIIILSKMSEHLFNQYCNSGKRVCSKSLVLCVQFNHQVPFGILKEFKDWKWDNHYLKLVNDIYPRRTKKMSIFNLKAIQVPTRTFGGVEIGSIQN